MADLLIADTDLAIDFLRDAGEAATVERWLRQRRVRFTAVTAFELRSGPDFERRRDAILTLLRRRTLPLDGASALRAGEVMGELRSRGIGIGVPDTLQAGICLRYGLPLATRNTRHFERVPGLRLAAFSD